MAVVRALLVQHVSRQQQVDVTEHLPQNEQRLLAHHPRRPELVRDAIRALRSVLERRGDSLGAAVVLDEAPLDQVLVALDRSTVAGEQRSQRHRRCLAKAVYVVGPRTWPQALLAGAGV